METHKSGCKDMCVTEIHMHQDRCLEERMLLTKKHHPIWENSGTRLELSLLVSCC